MYIDVYIYIFRKHEENQLHLKWWRWRWSPASDEAKVRRRNYDTPLLFEAACPLSAYTILPWPTRIRQNAQSMTTELKSLNTAKIKFKKSPMFRDKNQLHGHQANSTRRITCCFLQCRSWWPQMCVDELLILKLPHRQVVIFGRNFQTLWQLHVLVHS